MNAILRVGWFLLWRDDTTMGVAMRFIGLVFLGFSTILANAQGMAASVEETLDKLNRFSTSERQATLEREARKEGRVVFYTTFNVADLQDLKRLFEQRYPFLILESFRLGHGRLA